MSVKILKQLIHNGKAYFPGDLEHAPTKHMLGLASEGELAEHHKPEAPADEAKSRKPEAPAPDKK